MEESISSLGGAHYEIVSAIRELFKIPEIATTVSAEHVEETPQRFYDAMFEMYKGCYQNPKEVLEPIFEEKNYDELIYVNEIPFVSSCIHHCLPFFGRAYFAYLPQGRIVGLSKIPRLVEVFSRRPQIQEKLTNQIVDTFENIINPKGCGLVMEAYHLCMMIRGIKSSGYTKTSAIRGNFKTHDALRQEFFQGIRKTTEQLWP